MKHMKKNETYRQVVNDMMQLKTIFKKSQGEWETDKQNYEKEINNLKNEIRDLHNKKIEYVRQTVIEINNLRDVVKVLQKRLAEIPSKSALNENDGHSIHSNNTKYLTMSYWGFK